MSETWYPDPPWDDGEHTKRAIKHQIEKRLANLDVCYKREVSATVHIYVGTEFKGDERSQYLTLYIVKTDTGDVIKLRMKTVRNIFKFLVGKKFVPKPRRLWLWEKIKPGWL